MGCRAKSIAMASAIIARMHRQARKDGCLRVGHVFMSEGSMRRARRVGTASSLGGQCARVHQSASRMSNMHIIQHGDEEHQTIQLVGDEAALQSIGDL